MPRGGPRPGAGRPKGSTSKVKQTESRPRKTAAENRPLQEVAEREKLPLAMTPLEYMLHVMNSQSATPDRRDRMAVAAAPYVHGKKGEGGKKDALKDAAQRAANKFAPKVPPKLVVNNTRRS